MRERTARMVELDREQRNKFLEMTRTFLKEECDIEVDEELYVVPDVEFDQNIVQLLGISGSNPFLLEPGVVNKLLDTATYTFTWYEFSGADDSANEPTVSVVTFDEMIDGLKKPSPWGKDDPEDDDGSVH